MALLQFKTVRRVSVRVASAAGLALLCCFAISLEGRAQPPRSPQPAKNPQPPKIVQPPAKKATPPRKLTEAEKAAQAVLNAYTDAANFQNSGAYPLAIEAWEKLLKNFPNDPLASKARHYLGICYLRVEKPDYELAAKHLRAALDDKNLEVREEGLVELGRALFQSASSADEANRKKKLEEASKIFAGFLEKYADGNYADQALFYAGESEFQLGRYDRAANLFRRLTEMPSMAQSALRADALFSLGVAYEEQKQTKLAIEAYESFLKSYPKNPLAREVRLRLAEQFLAADKPSDAVERLREIAGDDKGEMQDYVLYRYGYALAKAGKFAESSDVYKKLSEKFPKSTYASGSSLAAGQALMREKKYDQAAEYFQRLLPAQDNTAAEAAHLLCQIALMQGRGGDAIPIARGALEWSASSPRFVALKMDLAEALAAGKETQAEARSMFEQIFVEHPDDPVAPRAAYNAAFAALQAGQLAEAQRWSEQFAKQYNADPLAPDVAYIFAESTLQLGQFKEAATSLEQLIKAQKEHPSRELWQLRWGHALYMGDQHDKAITEMIKLGKSSADRAVQAEAYFLVGACLLRQEKFDESAEAIGRCLEASKKWSQADEAHLILAQAQLRSQKSKEAKATLQALIQEYPNSRFRGQAELRIGQIAASTEEYDEALKRYDAVVQSQQDKNIKEVASYGKAWVLMQREKYSAAAEILQPIVSGDRKDAVAIEANFALAICFRHLEKGNQAVKILEKLAAEPSSTVPLSKALYELGLTYVELKQLNKASAVFDRLIREFPKLENMDKILYEYAWALKEQDQQVEAEKIFTKLSEAYPKSPLAAEADYHLGQKAYEEEAFDRAVIAYTSAVSRSKDAELQEKSMYKLGWAYFQQKDYEQAASEFAKQSRAFPKSSLSIEAIFMQAECMMKLNNFAQAFTLYQQARKSMEANLAEASISEQVRTLAYLHGAQSARELKKWEEVDEWLLKLMVTYPESSYKPYAVYELAYSAQNQRESKKAVELYTQVAEENRNEIGARARFMIGELYFAERDFAKAVQEFQKVIYGFGGTQAADDVKNWQARASIEAGRCSEVLIENLKGQKRTEAIRIARKFYQHVVEQFPNDPLASQAKASAEKLDRLASAK